MTLNTAQDMATFLVGMGYADTPAGRRKVEQTLARDFGRTLAQAGVLVDEARVKLSARNAELDRLADSER